ncbi:unnamed protein product [Knipowitschia caucasica]|uniref:Secreted protein n=1 Tax=Knipowitschia caucasica TaxID=637954 RepID=A0AAV2JB37_KNICA
MPMLCSRTRAWAALTLFHRRLPLLTSRNTCCFYRCRSPTIKPLSQPEKARAISALTPAGSFCNIANMSTENSSSAAMSQRMVWVDLEVSVSGDVGLMLTYAYACSVTCRAAHAV